MQRMTKADRRASRFGLLALTMVFALVGCQENGVTFGQISATAPQEPEVDLSANRGVPVAPGAPVSPADIAATRGIGARGDVFAMLPQERQFDFEQTTERILSQSQWATEVEEDLDAGVEQPIELAPIPRWRLSGVIIGSGVMALLDMGNRTIEIWPGMAIPGTEWTVVSIDSEKAVLERPANRLPSQIEVGLQGPLRMGG